MTKSRWAAIPTLALALGCGGSGRDPSAPPVVEIEPPPARAQTDEAADAGRNDAALEPVAPMPSLELPDGLTEQGRGQFLVLLALILSIHGELRAIETSWPTSCSPVEDGCAGDWQKLGVRLGVAVRQLESRWVDCRRLDPIDARAFVERAREHQRWAMDWVRRMVLDVETLIKSRGWGARASTRFRELVAAALASELREPRCE
jgi:hypothetical protein